MKPKITLFFTLIFVALFNIFSISFADTLTATAYNLNKKTISLKIEGTENTIFYNESFEIRSINDTITALEAIEQAVGKENITTVTSYHGDKYIYEINDESELLKNGEYAGWRCMVNGIEPSITVDKLLLNDKDKMLVYYGTLTSEYPKDFFENKKNENINTKILSDDYIITDSQKKFDDIEDARLNLLVSIGIVQGEPDNRFYPENNITRAEFITFLAKLSKEKIKTDVSPVFEDTPTKEWYYNTVMWGYEKGIVTGYQNKFEPDEFLTREDLAVMFVKYLEKIEGYEIEEVSSQFIDTKEMYDYSISSIANLAKLDFIKGKPNNIFDPKAFATRYETVLMLTNFLDIKYQDIDFKHDHS